MRFNTLTKRKIFEVSIILLMIILTSCESEKKIPPKGYLPSNNQQTQILEASYFWIPQNQLTSSYWKQADYIQIIPTDLSKGKLYDDGYLNMTGTFKGTKDFNKGTDPKIKIKAGYDEEYLYILIEWKDTTYNASFMSWLWDGPADNKKADSTNGWTSQRNQDSFTILFDKQGTDTKDVWKWSLALTAPFDMAQNLRANSSGTVIEDYSAFFRNSSENSSRKGPDYEWNGERQEIFLANGTKKLIDPVNYLLDDFKTQFLGDVKSGQNVFNVKAECSFCHGPNGNGESNDEGGSDGGLLARQNLNKYSREGLLAFISDDSHEGSADQYFGRIRNSPVDQQNLLAYLRSISGVPGYMLKKPETDPDINAQFKSSGTLDTKNSSYTVLLRRKLQTTNPEDIQFNSLGNYTFSIRFSDSDDLNYVGETNLELIFKSNAL